MTYDERSFFKLITCLARMLVTHVVSKKKSVISLSFTFPSDFTVDAQREEAWGKEIKDKR